MALVVGVGFLSASDPIADIDHFHPLANRLIGLGAIGALIAYLAWVFLMRWRGASVLGVRLPGPRLTLGQMALGVIDICSAAAALYVLLPRDNRFGFPAFATLYSFASMLGIASHAPGGLGVFEATILQGVGGDEDACWLRSCSSAASITSFRSSPRWRCWAASRRCAVGVRCAKRCRRDRTTSGRER